MKTTKQIALKIYKSVIFRIFLIVVVLAVLLVPYCRGHRSLASNLLKTTYSFVSTNKTAKVIKPKILGPKQTDPDFTAYPSWAQNFEAYGSRKLSHKYWNINIGSPDNGNNEAEYYTSSPANLRISDGSLVMEATQQAEPGNLDYASSRIDTQGKLSFLYGRMDVVVKMPVGVGTWPAVWFLPANTKYEDMSPASDTTRFLNGGEIDMLEAVGFTPQEVYSIVHTLQTSQNNPNAVGDYKEESVLDDATSYNHYTMLWTPTSITFEINNTPYFTYAKPTGANYVTWPFDQPFYMILDLALGGEWGGQDTADFPGNGIDNSSLPAQMDIQSIYYYRYIGR